MSKQAIAEEFLERIEAFKEKKEEKIKVLQEELSKEHTFKPKTYSTYDIAARYYERQVRKMQEEEALQMT